VVQITVKVMMIHGRNKDIDPFEKHQRKEKQQEER
jgi:hypothetical protein